MPRCVAYDPLMTPLTSIYGCIFLVHTAGSVFLLQEHLLVESSNRYLHDVIMPACFSPLFFYAALALKGIDYEYRAVHLLKDGGEQVQICP